MHPAAQWSRRACLGAIASLTTSLGSPRAFAGPAAAKLAVSAPNHAVGALVALVGGDDVHLSIDATLSAETIRIADSAPASVTDRILLKAKGRARARYLDDARNATRAAANVRDALSLRDPERKAAFAKRHADWSRTFARRVLQWHEQLQKSNVRDRTIKDAHGRIYLLEWAGAVVRDDATDKGPQALARLPDGPTAATITAYEQYVEQIVRSVT